LTGRLCRATPGADAGGAVFGGVALLAGGLAVDFGAAQARQDIGHFAGHQMAAVELGGHLYRQAQLAPGRLDPGRVRHSAHEIAAHADEAPDAAIEDAFAGFDRVHAILARRLEAELPTQVVDRYLHRLFGDADGALALHVGMAAHRQDAGTFLAHVAA